MNLFKIDLQTSSTITLELLVVIVVVITIVRLFSSCTFILGLSYSFAMEQVIVIHFLFELLAVSFHLGGDSNSTLIVNAIS